LARPAFTAKTYQFILSRSEREIARRVDELGLEDAPEVTIGAVETVLGAEAYQPFQGHRGCDLACLERGVELTHAVPLLGNLHSVDGLVGAADQRYKRTVVAVGIDPVDALVLDSSDARAEAQAQHREGGEVDLGIAVGVGVMLFDLELALVVTQTVEYEGSITVGEGIALLAHAIKLDPENPVASERFFQELIVHREKALALPITSFNHQDEVVGAAFGPDGARILTASADKTAKLWDAASGKLIASFDHISQIAFRDRKWARIFRRRFPRRRR
jgi:hypothetical protein